MTFPTYASALDYALLRRRLTSVVVFVIRINRERRLRVLTMREINDLQAAGTIHTYEIVGTSEDK